MRGRRAPPQTPPLNDSPTPTPSQPHANPKLCFLLFFENKKDARRPYDHFPPIFAPRSLLCVRKRRFPFLKKDIILSVIWSVICLRNLLLKLRTLQPHFHMRRGSGWREFTSKLPQINLSSLLVNSRHPDPRRMWKWGWRGTSWTISQ